MPGLVWSANPVGSALRCSVGFQFCRATYIQSPIVTQHFSPILVNHQYNSHVLVQQTQQVHSPNFKNPYYTTITYITFIFKKDLKFIKYNCI